MSDESVEDTDLDDELVDLAEEMVDVKELQARRARTINTTRKATVTYPTVKRLLFHMFFATHLQKLLESHEMV